ncbi:hypothetical protein Agub_g13464 [Astrephomene gubernaculifera]|uniref:EF-hand domain-containing protein n=1 Tax=Astrephomene gubernaculifera TaxID=47775 RepID=A0AAD3DZU5_9CHLO|nr:hypothetical protein Agub_g13464 [Astrephomene gubernaculifera]
MQTKVYPSPQKDLGPPSSHNLRQEPVLNTEMADSRECGVERTSSNVSSSSELPRSEFHLLLDFLDTDANGMISALELANFVDSLLGTQDHERPEGSIIFEAVLTAAIRHAAQTDDDAPSNNHWGPKPCQAPPPPPPPPTTTQAIPALRAQPSSEQPTAAAAPGAQRWSSGRGGGGSTAKAGGMGGGTAGTTASLNHQQSSRVGEVAGREVQSYGSQCFLPMDAVQRCFEGLLADTELWVELAGRYSILTTCLFRQLLMYAGGRLERTFSLGGFARSWVAFNTLPLWLPFRRLWATSPTLLPVYLHQITKLHSQLGAVGLRGVLLGRQGGQAGQRRGHVVLLWLTMAQFVATYVPLVAFFAAHGIPNMWRTHSAVDFFHANPLAQQLSVFGSVLPWAVLQFLTSSGALKLNCRDFVSLKDQCKAVFLLGDVSSQFEGYPGLTLRQVMDDIKRQVVQTLNRSHFRRLNALMPLLFSIALELFRKLVRVFLVHNWVASERLARVVVPFEVYGLLYNIWFAYSESADCTAYLYQLKKTCAVFKTLLTKEEALSQSLPWLNNHSPRNLLMWARLRRYYQSPNCLELRWIEMHLTLVVLAAVAVTAVLIVTFVQKTLLRFTAENADLQMFVAWVIPPFMYLIAGLVIDVIFSASTGQQYHDGITTLSAGGVAIADRLNSAAELTAPGLEGEGGEGQQSGEGGVAASPPAPATLRWRPAERFRLSPWERSRLRECQEIIRSVVSYIQFNPEYITLFGVPIDTQLRNTLASVAVTLAGAGVSAFLALLLQK